MSEPVVAEPCVGTLLDARWEPAAATELARGFAALSDPVRLRLLALLASATSGEVCVCDLVAAVGRSQPTVSHHLKVLGSAGLVHGQRRGRWVWYALDRARIDALRGALGG